MADVPYPPRSRRLTRIDWINRVGFFFAAFLLGTLGWEDIGADGLPLLLLGVLVGFLAGRTVIKRRLARLERGGPPWSETLSSSQRVVGVLCGIALVAAAIIIGFTFDRVAPAIGGFGPGVLLSLGAYYPEDRWCRLVIQARRLSAAARPDRPTPPPEVSN